METPYKDWCCWLLRGTSRDSGSGTRLSSPRNSTSSWFGLASWLKNSHPSAPHITTTNPDAFWTHLGASFTLVSTARSLGQRPASHQARHDTLCLDTSLDAVTESSNPACHQERRQSGQAHWSCHHITNWTSASQLFGRQPTVRTNIPIPNPTQPLATSPGRLCRWRTRQSPSAPRN